MYCQWCAKERDPDSLAIHHCGPKDRPPVFCMQCAEPLEGAAACASCGTLAGEAPKPVAAVVAAVPAADEAGAAAPVAGGPMPAAAAPATAGGGPMPASTMRPAAAVVPKPVAAQSRATETDELGGALRVTTLIGALMATLGFFIPWYGGGGTGITAVYQDPWHLWSPTSAQYLFGVVLAALLLSIAACYGARSAGVYAATAVLGLVATVIGIDYVWLLRHVVSLITGQWVVIGGSVVLLVGSLASFMHARSS